MNTSTGRRNITRRGKAPQTRSEQGASLVEYGLLVALIALVCFAAVVFLGGDTSDSFSRVGASVAAT